VAAADGSFDPGKTLAVLEHTLRLRHYSPRTLGTYLDWAVDADLKVICFGRFESFVFFDLP